MRDPVNVGIVGIGYGQQVHVPAFRADSRCRVVAICGSSADRAKRVAERLSIPCAFAHWQELVDCNDLDIVSIAVPPALQPEVAEAAASAGKHLFCEKPIASDATHAKELLRRVTASGVRHAVDFIFPEIPAFQRAKQVISGGEIGELRHLSLTWHVETRAYRTNDRTSWKMDVSKGGGTLNSFVSHALYYLEWLIGPIASAAGRLTGPQESRATVWLDFENGCSGSLSVAADTPNGTGHRLEVYGSDGAVILENTTRDYADGFAVTVSTREQSSTEPPNASSGSDGRIAATARIVSRLIDAIGGGAAVRPSLEDGARVAAISEAIRDSAR